MNKNIKQILKDLYKLDKNLKNYEKELIELIQKLIVSRPIDTFSNEFKERLKMEIMAKIEDIKATQPQLQSTFSLTNKLSYGAIGGLIVVVLALPILYLNNNSINPAGTLEVIESLGLNNNSLFKQLEKNAFGQITPSQEKIAANDSSMTSRPQSGGGGGGGGMSLTSPLFAPVFYNYKFSYIGEDFKIEESEMAVFKRYVNDNLQSKLAKIIKDVNFGFINISSLSNPKLQNFNLVEDIEGGYSVAVNLNEESASINVYYDQSYQVTEQRSLSQNDIPSDDKIINVTNNLFKKFGLKLENYGEPVIDNSWQIYYIQANDGAMNYVPDIISVTYPIKINELAVYDENGNPNGPQVNFNIRHNRAEGAWGINSNNFQSSNYSIEQDNEKILKLALNGGYRRYYDQQSSGETINIELGTPKVSLVAINNFKNGTYEQLFVPALIFPVYNDIDKTKFYQKNIVVPLVKDLLNESINQPQPRPLPVDLMIK